MRPTSLLRATAPLRPSRVLINPTTHILPSLTTTTTTTTRRAQSTSPINTPTPPSRPHAVKQKTGTVISVGKMQRTVTVEHRTAEWDRHLRRSYPRLERIMVADPNDSCREGDVVEILSGFKKTKHVKHVIGRIVAPFGVPVEARPPVLGLEELVRSKEEKRARKVARAVARAEGEVEGDAEKVEGEGESERVVEVDAVPPTPRMGRIKSLVEVRLARAEARKAAANTTII